MYSIMIMCRAHEASLIKSKRSAAAWEKRRRDAAQNGTPFSKLCPPWLRIEEGKYVPMPDRVQTVDMIFTMAYYNGMGSYSIARELNRHSIISFAGKSWRDHVVHDLLHNATVCGRYTPKTCSYKNGKRIAKALPTVENYYPEVIPADIFDKLQLELSKRRVIKESGRRGNNRNIFKHIVKCEHCGAGISYKNKTRTTYLAAHGTAVERTCNCHRYWSYPDFEKRVITALFFSYRAVEKSAFRHGAVTATRDVEHGVKAVERSQPQRMHPPVRVEGAKPDAGRMKTRNRQQALIVVLSSLR